MTILTDNPQPGRIKDISVKVTDPGRIEDVPITTASPGLMEDTSTNTTSATNVTDRPDTTDTNAINGFNVTKGHTNITFKWTGFTNPGLSNTTDGMKYYEWTLVVDHGDGSSPEHLLKWNKITDISNAVWDGNEYVVRMGTVLMLKH